MGGPGEGLSLTGPRAATMASDWQCHVSGVRERLIYIGERALPEQRRDVDVLQTARRHVRPVLCQNISGARRGTRSRAPRRFSLSIPHPIAVCSIKLDSRTALSGCKGRGGPLKPVLGPQGNAGQNGPTGRNGMAGKN